MMSAYNYGMQWNKDPWTKIDYRKVHQTGYTNGMMYNTVGVPWEKIVMPSTYSRE